MFRIQKPSRIHKHLRFPLQPILSQKGSSLVSTLSAVGLISALVFYMWSSILQHQTEIEKTKVVTSRDLVVVTALRNARVATYYYRTILKNDPENDMLIKCLIDDDLGPDCVVAGSPYPMKLVDYDSATATYLPITGTAADPTYYDYYGQTCSPVSEDCPFQVTATFTPICDLGAATCASAASIQVFVQVQYVSPNGSLSLSLAQSSSMETVAINDFQNNYFPVLPPTTDIGTPITAGTGVAGFITKYVQGLSGGPAPPPAGPAPAAAPAPVVPTSTVCQAGQVNGGTCGAFTF